MLKFLKVAAEAAILPGVILGGAGAAACFIALFSVILTGDVQADLPLKAGLMVLTGVLLVAPACLLSADMSAIEE